MDIEKLIKDSFDNLVRDFEMRKSYFLNKLHHNIDELVKYSNEWFNGEIPAEFSNILSSLMNLSVSYYDEIDSFKNLLNEKNYTVFNPIKVFNDLVVKDNEIKKYINIDDNNSNVPINTSYSTLYDSIHNIFVCIQQFFNEKSFCNISFSKENTSIKIIIFFKNLNYFSNELNKLTKVFFTFNNDSSMELRVGLNIPIEKIKSIGGIINISESNNYKDIAAIISFPSNEFLKTVEDIRKLYRKDDHKKKNKNIIISINDKILEMILRDTFEDYGYNTIVIDIDRIPFEIDESKNNIVFLDTTNILNKFSSFNEFKKKNEIKNRTFIIKNDENEYKINTENTEIITLPFEIDEIMEKL